MVDKMTKNKNQTTKREKTGNKQNIRETFDKSIHDNVRSSDETTGSTGPRNKSDKKK